MNSLIKLDLRAQLHPSVHRHLLEEMITEANLCQYASELAIHTNTQGPETFTKVMKGAIRACKAMELPVRENFKLVYRGSDHGMVIDWKISIFASRLIQMNDEIRSSRSQRTGPISGPK